MWQEEDEARLHHPLGLAAAHVRVENGLSAVEEVAELRLPDDQIVRVVERVAVLVAHDGLLGQVRVAHLEEVPLGRTQVVERYVDARRPLVDEHRVSLTEGAAAHLLAADTHTEALGEERADGERLGR